MSLKDLLHRDYIPVSEAAELANVTPQTIRNWYNSGKIRKYIKRKRKQIYVSKEDVIAMNEIEESLGVGS